jgi:hypothetical protein
MSQALCCFTGTKASSWWGRAQAAGSTARYLSLACWLQHGKTESVGYAEKLLYGGFAGAQLAQRQRSLGVLSSIASLICCSQ